MAMVEEPEVVRATPDRDKDVLLLKGECGHDILCQHCNEREVVDHETWEEVAAAADALTTLLSHHIGKPGGTGLDPSNELELARATAFAIFVKANDRRHETLGSRQEFVKGKHVALVAGGRIVRFGR